MKAGYQVVLGCFILMLLWPGQVAATSLSGKMRLNNQGILISGPQKYYGQFDLRSKLPMGDEFVLSKVIVSFKFQDDKEWIRKPGKNSLEDTGKTIRHDGFLLKKKSIAGQTDHYFTAKSIVHLSNEEEVAELIIGRDKYYGTTMRRRDVTTEVQGKKNIILGTYRDEGDSGKLRQHHRITESVLEVQRDGYDGLFEMRHKILDLTSAQNLAKNGVLDFELGGKGDYIFVEATLKYEGYTSGLVVSEDTGDVFSAVPVWGILLSIILGGGLWLSRIKISTQKKPVVAARRNRRKPQAA